MDTNEKQIKTWAKEFGVTPKQLMCDDMDLLQAKRIATNILKQHTRYLGHNVAAALNNFLKAASGSKKSKITKSDCYRIMNIGTEVNRKIFKAQRKGNHQGK